MSADALSAGDVLVSGPLAVVEGNSSLAGARVRFAYLDLRGRILLYPNTDPGQHAAAAPELVVQLDSNTSIIDIQPQLADTTSRIIVTGRARGGATKLLHLLNDSLEGHQDWLRALDGIAKIIKHHSMGTLEIDDEQIRANLAKLARSTERPEDATWDDDEDLLLDDDDEEAEEARQGGDSGGGGGGAAGAARDAGDAAAVSSGALASGDHAAADDEQKATDDEGETDAYAVDATTGRVFFQTSPSGATSRRGSAISPRVSLAEEERPAGGAARMSIDRAESFAHDADGSTIVHCSWLMKRGRLNKKLKRRWVTLWRDGRMEYRAKRPDPSLAKLPRANGAFSIAGSDIFMAPDVARDNGFQVDTGHRVWQFQCETPKDRKRWLRALVAVQKRLHDTGRHRRSVQLSPRNSDQVRFRVAGALPPVYARSDDDDSFDSGSDTIPSRIRRSLRSARESLSSESTHADDGGGRGARDGKAQTAITGPSQKLIKEHVEGMNIDGVRSAQLQMLAHEALMKAPPLRVGSQSESDLGSSAGDSEDGACAVVSCLTWNLGRELPQPKDMEFIKELRGSHVVAIGAQESQASMLITDKAGPFRIWQNMLVAALGPHFVPLCSKLLGAIHLVVFVRDEALPWVSGVSAGVIPCGMGNISVNKGAVGVSLYVKDRHLCFVSAHLTAGPKKLVERNANLDRIFQLLPGQLEPFWTAGSTLSAVVGDAFSKSVIEKEPVRAPVSDAERSWQAHTRSSQPKGSAQSSGRVLKIASDFRRNSGDEKADDEKSSAAPVKGSGSGSGSDDGGPAPFDLDLLRKSSNDTHTATGSEDDRGSQHSGLAIAQGETTIMEGLLKKRKFDSKRFWSAARNWPERWFFLTRTRICYASERAKDIVKGSFLLTPTTVAEVVPPIDVDRRMWVIRVRNRRPDETAAEARAAEHLLLQAENEEERNLWRDKINETARRLGSVASKGLLPLPVRVHGAPKRREQEAPATASLEPRLSAVSSRSVGSSAAPTTTAQSHSERFVERFDACFFFGDLNYRLELEKGAAEAIIALSKVKKAEEEEQRRLREARSPASPLSPIRSPSSRRALLLRSVSEDEPDEAQATRVNEDLITRLQRAVSSEDIADADVTPDPGASPRPRRHQRRRSSIKPRESIALESARVTEAAGVATRQRVAAGVVKASERFRGVLRALNAGARTGGAPSRGPAAACAPDPFDAVFFADYVQDEQWTAGEEWRGECDAALLDLQHSIRTFCDYDYSHFGDSAIVKLRRHLSMNRRQVEEAAGARITALLQPQSRTSRRLSGDTPVESFESLIRMPLQDEERAAVSQALLSRIQTTEATLARRFRAHSVGGEEMRAPTLSSVDVLEAMLEYDQLRAQFRAGRAFQGWSEGPITFFPTYKYDPFTDTFDTKKGRVCSWTDRIFHAESSIADARTAQEDSAQDTAGAAPAPRGVPERVHQLAYAAVQRPFHCDHRPVLARYVVEL